MRIQSAFFVFPKLQSRFGGNSRGPLLEPCRELFCESPVADEPRVEASLADESPCCGACLLPSRGETECWSTVGGVGEGEAVMVVGGLGGVGDGP